MDQTTTGGTDWGTWLQNLTSSAVGIYGAQQAQQSNQDFQLQQAKVQYLGQAGYYTAGQPGIANQGLKISGGMLLLLAAVVAIVVLEK